MGKTVDIAGKAPAGAPRAAQSAAIRKPKAKKVARTRLDPAIRAEQILDEALRLFAERHYSNVTIRDIALASAVNPALIYYYFESKEHLFSRALGHAIDQLNAGYETLRGGAGDARAEIMAWLDIHISIAPTLTRMTKLMADHAASNAGETAASALIARFYEREQALLEDCIGRGVASGVFRDIDVSKTARTISLQLDGIFYASTSRGDERIAEDIGDLRWLVGTLLDPPSRQ